MHLQSLEGMRFDDLHKNGSHRIEILGLSKRARERIQELGLEELDELFSLRIEGRLRIWAVQQGSSSTLELLWYDPKHEVCPSHKKHT